MGRESMHGCLLYFGCEGTFSADECLVITPYRAALVEIIGPSGQPEMRTIIYGSLAANEQLVDGVGFVSADRDAVPDLLTSRGAPAQAAWLFESQPSEPVPTLNSRAGAVRPPVQHGAGSQRALTAIPARLSRRGSD